MTPKEILEEEDHFPIGSIDKSKVILVKEPNDNGVQFITIERDEVKLKLALQCSDHHLDTDYDGYISIVCGKPVNNKPTGIIFRIIKGNPRVNITEKATVKLGTSSEERVISKPEESKPQLTEGKEESGEQEAGPSDSTIMECFYERLHILNILNKLNDEYGNPFSKEAIFPMVTSVFMDAMKAGKKILPSVHKSPKKRFDPIDKPHNPKQESKKTVTGDPITEWISGQTQADYLDVKNPKGRTVGEIFSDADSRPKALRWFFINKADQGNSLKKNSDKVLYEAFDELFNECPSSMQVALCYIGVGYDVSILHDVPFTDTDKISDIVEAKLTQYKGKFDLTNAKGVTINYFKQDEEDRATPF